MCGLVFFTGSKPVDPIKLNILLHANENRGTHSTGVYANGKLVKAAMEATDFINTPEYKAQIVGANTVLGHTRFATMGAKNAANAHPYRIGEGRWQIIGMHNGWLFDTLLPDLAKKFGIEEADVDSKMIFEILHKTKDFQSLAAIEGAMAIAFIRDSKLYTYRRQSKPLFYGYTEEGIYFSSLRYPLDLIMARNIGFMKPDCLFEFKDGDLLNVTQIEQPVVKSLPLDALPSSWRQHVPPSERDHVPLYRKSLPYWPEQEISYRHPKPKEDYTKTPPPRQLSQNLSVDDTGTLNVFKQAKEFLNQLDNKKEVSLLFKSKDGVAWKEQIGETDSLVLVHLVNNNTNLPVSHWPLFVTNDPSMSTKTNLKGFAVVKAKGDPVELRLVTKDPISNKIYYSTTIKPIKGRVLEVTLNIPFRTAETKEKCDEGETDKQVNTDRSSNKYINLHSLYDGNYEDGQETVGAAEGGNSIQPNLPEHKWNKDLSAAEEYKNLKSEEVHDEECWQEEGYSNESEWWAAINRDWKNKFVFGDTYDDIHDEEESEEDINKLNKLAKELRTVNDRLTEVEEVKSAVYNALDIGATEEMVTDSLSRAHGLLASIAQELEDIQIKIQKDIDFCPF